MNDALRITAVAVAGATLLAGCMSMQPGPKNMTFFVTSVGPGQGANLGGVAGADKHCQTLAQAAGAGDRTWHAYLSTQAPALNSPDFVNARDRIGAGPWQNYNGVVIATSVDDLHSANNKISKETAISEKGERLNSRSENPNRHDILTGSRPDGTAFPGAPFVDMTCGNWTKGGTEGSAMVGHFDKGGPIDSATWATSWNSSHPTRGCDQPGIISTGGAGYLYCFAAK